MAEDVLWGIDSSSHNGKGAAYKRLLQQHKPTYVADHCYTSYEQAGLVAYTEDHAAACKTLGIPIDPYLWSFGKSDPYRQADEMMELGARLGMQMGTLWLDCETYGTPVQDPGPNADWLSKCIERLERGGFTPGIYTALWWIKDWFPGGFDEFANFRRIRLWLAQPDGVDDISAVRLPPGFDKAHGKQWDSSGGLDRDVFLHEVLQRAQPPAPPAPPPPPGPTLEELAARLADLETWRERVRAGVA